MKAPTDKQIEAEIKALESLKPKVPQGTMTDNKRAIDAQIAVLKGRLDHDAIYDRWPDDERDAEIRFDASDAREWMEGEKQEKPSKGWQELVR